MTRPFLDRLASLVLGQGRDIHDRHNQLLLTRWYVWPRTRDQEARDGRRVRVLLHRLAGDDSHRELHDHPWSFLSITLGGRGYIEWIPNRHHGENGRASRSQVERRPWTIAYRPAEWLHAVKLHRHPETFDLVPQWTLVIAGPRRRAWGFLTTTGWERWDIYWRRVTGAA